MRLFVLCSGMEWCHLPVAGGLYDQHPQLLDDWVILFQAQSRKAKRDKAKADAEAARKK